LGNDNINQYKQKLLRSIEGLKQDFNNNKISQDKYNSLLKLYDNKLKTLNATLRVREMQGLTKDNDFEHEKEDDELELNHGKRYNADKYIVKQYNNKKHENNEKPKSNKRYIVIATSFLILAFIAGVTSGFFNYHQKMNSESANVDSLQISESAFPPIMEYKSYTPTTKTSNYQYSSSYNNNEGSSYNNEGKGEDYTGNNGYKSEYGESMADEPTDNVDPPIEGEPDST
jgi:hypothetical protein